MIKNILALSLMLVFVASVVAQNLNPLCDKRAGQTSRIAFLGGDPPDHDF
jgi:hypothetical protein